MRRTQIYLDDEQTARLDERAVADGVSRSTLIRRAIDDLLSADEHDPEEWRSRWLAALASSEGVAPGLADGAAYVDALRTADAHRLREWET